MEIIKTFEEFQLNESKRIKREEEFDINFHGTNLTITIMPVEFDNDMLGFIVRDADTYEQYIMGNLAYEDDFIYLYMISVENPGQGWGTDFFKFMQKWWPKKFGMKFEHSKVHSQSGKKWLQSLDENLNESVIGTMSALGNTFSIIKNPGTIKKLDKLSRILISPAGDLYIVNDGGMAITHFELYNKLRKMGEIPRKYEIYDEVIAWQKSNNEYDVMLSDSYDKWENEDPEIKENARKTTELYQKKQKNKNINFIYQKIDS